MSYFTRLAYKLHKAKKKVLNNIQSKLVRPRLKDFVSFIKLANKGNYKFFIA